MIRRVIDCQINDLPEMIREYRALELLLGAMPFTGGNLAEQKEVVGKLEAKLLSEAENLRRSTLKEYTGSIMPDKRGARRNLSLEAEISRLREQFYLESEKLKQLEDSEDTEKPAKTEYREKWKAWYAKWTMWGEVEDYPIEKEIPDGNTNGA